MITDIQSDVAGRGHSSNQAKFNVTGDGMTTEEKFEQFHKAHPCVYPAFVKAAHRMMYMKRGRFGAQAVCCMAQYWYGLVPPPNCVYVVPKDIAKHYAFLAVENGDVPADAFAFRTHSRKVQ